MNSKKILIFTTLLTLLGSCMLNNDIDLDFPQSPQNLMVECYLKPSEHFELTLMETNSLSNELYLHLLWGAKVDIISNSDTIHLFNGLNHNKKTLYTYNYGSPLRVPSQAVDLYELRVITKQGDTLISQTKCVSPLTIAKTELFSDRLIVYIDKVDFENPFYAINIEGHPDPEVTNSFKSYNLEKLKGQKAYFVIRSNFVDWENIKLRLFHITKEHYDFYKSSDAASDANLDPFTTPEQLKSNIQNGIGIFTHQTVDSLTINVKANIIH